MSALKYYLFYKPFGVLSQFTREVESHKVLGDYYNFPPDVYSVGRLDKDSEGLLLLTNDKKCTDYYLNPKHHKSKTYWVQMEGQITKQAIEEMQRGVSIKLPSKKLYRTKPCQVGHLTDVKIAERIPPIRFRQSIPTSWISITLSEGKNRQVRKMCAKVGFPCLRLIRYSFDKFKIEGMKTGEVKEVSGF